MSQVFKPTYVIPELGEFGQLPDGAIINAGGVTGPFFTIGGQAVILKDGTASDGSGPVIITGGGGGGGGGNVFGFEYVQTNPATIWTIAHNRNTTKIQSTIWTETNEILYPDTVQIVNTNTVVVVFNTPQVGRAILILFQ